ncbi:hypothetical protein K445DRAFT_321599 [Daldinia sp. EC12]|nr:hypothetical protein K445DRAFT_321599 [Daldinia sp. EC12]
MRNQSSLIIIIIIEVLSMIRSGLLVAAALRYSQCQPDDTPFPETPASAYANIVNHAGVEAHYVDR